MNPDVVVAALRDLVAETLKRWAEEGEAEVQSINRQLGYAGSDKQFVADVPPKFITGNPSYAAASKNGYILVVSLNHRYVRNAVGHVAEDYAALRSNAEDHLAACLDYFRQPRRRIYGFFTGFRHVLAGFNAAGDSGLDLHQALCQQTLFVDHLPYFSIKSGDYPGTLTQRAAMDNRRFIETLIAEVPPRSVLLSGKAAKRAFDPDPGAPFGGVSDYRDHRSKAQTADGPFTYKAGTFKLPRGGSIRVVGCNFLGRRSGPNSKAQQFELGTLLAGA